MALKECLDCGHPVSNSAWKCPRCGRSDPAKFTTEESLKDLIFGDKDTSVSNKIFSRLKGGSSNNSQKRFVGGADLDVYFKLQITPENIKNGCKKDITVNEEKLEVSIPPGVKYGSKLRLKRKGNLNRRTMERGDLYLVLVQ